MATHQVIDSEGLWVATGCELPVSPIAAAKCMLDCGKTSAGNARVWHVSTRYTRSMSEQ